MGEGTDYRGRFETWLTAEGARETSLPGLLNGFCCFLNREGFAIRRCNLATETVHPLMSSTRHVWSDAAVDASPINPAVIVARRQYRMGDALIDEVFFNAGSHDNPQYVASPFYQIELRGRLCESIAPAGAEQAYPVFHDLAAIGCTAYFGMKLRSFAGLLQTIGLASARPGGLEAGQEEDLGWSLSLLTLHIDTVIEHDVKNTLARVYVGRDPGQRVCAGMIARGAVVRLEAAIWFSDVRGFTAISDGLAPEQLIESLNAYFEAVAGTIYEVGGEVLKYVGDAILAVFPAEKFAGRAAACRAALNASEAAARRLTELNRVRAALGAPLFAHGVGLHVGEVQYGNIGSSDRLDFTVIGREVNIASRIEGLCKPLGEPVLCSGSFAAAAGAAMREVGRHALKGMAEEIAILAPAGD